MKKADNRAFLAYLKRNEIANYYTLERIVNAGQNGYGIKKTDFLTVNGFPSSDYIELCENIFGELTVYIHTENAAFMSAAFAKIKTDSKKYKRLMFGVSDDSVFETAVFKKYFTLTDLYGAEYGDFAFLGDKRTFSFVTPEIVTVDYIENPKTFETKFDNEIWDGLQKMIDLGKESDLLTLIYWDGVLCGYLYATNLYEKYYDVSNVFVLPEYRGKGLGTYAAQFFMKYCFIKGFTPHYGTAVSAYSETVAKNAGFTETGRTHYAVAEVNGTSKS